MERTLVKSVRKCFKNIFWLRKIVASQKCVFNPPTPLYKSAQSVQTLPDYLNFFYEMCVEKVSTSLYTL